MADASTGQVTRNAAEVYEAFFVPALFLEWAPRVASAARLAAGQNVLDVACGTGVLAREAARRVQPGGTVTGLDRNEGMLAVARRKAPEIKWRLGRAEALPFEDKSFDAAISTFGIMFAPRQSVAAEELARVVRPGGRIALCSWRPAGFIGEMFKTVGSYVPPPAGVQSPLLWATEPHLSHLFGDGIASLDVK